MASGNFYIISYYERAIKGYYKGGITENTLIELMTRYQTYFIEPILYYMIRVTNFEKFETHLFDHLKDHVINYKCGNKSEWINLPLHEIIKAVEFLISEYDYEKICDVTEDTQHKICKPQNNTFSRKDADSVKESLAKNNLFYENKRIRLTIDRDNVYWFSLRDSIRSFDIKDLRDFIKKKVDKKYAKAYKFIDKIESNTDKVHPLILYITISGLLKMTQRCQLKTAIKFSEWVANVLSPAVYNYNIEPIKISHIKAQANDETKDKFLTKQLVKIKNETKNTNSTIYFVYSCSRFDDEHIYKIHYANNNKLKKCILNDRTYNNNNILLTLETYYPNTVLAYIDSMLYDYAINQSHIYCCSLDKIANVFSTCNKKIDCIYSLIKKLIYGSTLKKTNCSEELTDASNNID